MSINQAAAGGLTEPQLQLFHREGYLILEDLRAGGHRLDPAGRRHAGERLPVGHSRIAPFASPAAPIT